MTLLTLTWVAALVGKMAGAPVPGALAHHSSTGSEHRSIPWEAKRPLIDRYGKWAVELAEARCPEAAVECVEREARILYETMERRRR